VFVDVILVVPQHAVSLRDFGMALLGLLVSQAKVLGDSKQVSLGDIYAIVAAAVGRALRAVVQNAQRSAVLSSITSTAHSLPRAGNLGRMKRHSITRQNLSCKSTMREQPQNVETSV
jgi:hypothetical protein